MSEIRDRCARTIDYLRISVTDRCNLRCVYCMPASGVTPVKHSGILTYEEITRIVVIAAGLGVKKVRLTGGDPLVRKNLTRLISSIDGINGIEDISLTTNGQILGGMAGTLAESGLDRINVSLDSLRPDRYYEITRGGDLGAALAGIEAAEKAGLNPVKINVVPIEGLNDDEIEDFARLTLSSPIHVRFIEYMPVGTAGFRSRYKYMAADDIKERVGRIGRLEVVNMRSDGPARHFRLEGAPGILGFISPMTQHFCSLCNRLRLTSDGKLRPCLFSETEIDLKPALRGGAADNEIERLLRLAVGIKPESHNPSGDEISCLRKPMSKIGG
jgi:GTP 3',8-cyclase